MQTTEKIKEEWNMDSLSKIIYVVGKKTQLLRHKILTQKTCRKQIISSKNENIIHDHLVQSKQNKPRICFEFMSTEDMF